MVCGANVRFYRERNMRQKVALVRRQYIFFSRAIDALHV
jgi:hypothetical protein